MTDDLLQLLLEHGNFLNIHNPHSYMVKVWWDV